MLVPLELEMTKAMASSLVTRQFDAAALCVHGKGLRSGSRAAPPIINAYRQHEAQYRRLPLIASPTAETIAAK